MVIQEIQSSYTFPRIPLSLLVPAGYPELGKISNFSVVPQIAEYRFSREEMEIRGGYQITVSYFKMLSDLKVPVTEPRKLQCEFFDNMTLCANGLLKDAEECSSEGSADTRELYTVEFSRPIHTFIDLEFIGRPRSFRPVIIVESANLEIAGENSLKGELVLGLANRLRHR
ncbi:MAG: hypothetical protein RO469_09670 [Thermincola sp.]|nr:hypothetical protein [Thermincola sp.]MDT3702141.1 hypothetical protein [Thermincola sp.]